AADTLERIKDTGKIRLGHRTDARPFSYVDQSGKPAGYSLAVCEKVVDAVKSELALPQLQVEYLRVDTENRFEVGESGQIDLLCGASTVTLARRKTIDFSLPIFPSGISALLRADAPQRLKDVLSDRPANFEPRWRASLAQVLDKRVVSVTRGTTAAGWLA